MEQTLQREPVPAKAPSLTRHYLRYLSVNIAAIIGGAISFPLMARLLNQKDIGILGYYELFSVIWVAVLKMGTQSSIQRFYAAYCLGKGLEERQKFYATFVQVPALLSSVLFISSVLILSLIDYFHPITNVFYLYIVLVIGQFGVLTSLADNLIKAREQSKFSSIMSISGRYLQLTLVLGTITYLNRSATGVYLARLTGSVIIISVMLAWCLRHCDFNIRRFSPSLFRESLSFGLPLVFGEISYILLAFVDRFMLKRFNYGFDQLGIYTIGYTLAMYVGSFFLDALRPAFQPRINRLYETKGLSAVIPLQRSVLHILYYSAAGVGVSVLTVGGDLLLIIVGQKNAAAIPVFTWVSLNYLIFPVLFIMTYGLSLLKRTKLLSSTMFLCAVINIILNWFMIPRWGIMGPVYATILSYLVMATIQVIACPREYFPRPRVIEVIRPLTLAVLASLVAHWTHLFGLTNHIARLGVWGVIFILCYILPALLWDGALRNLVKRKLKLA